jgi:hypothetical protein
MEKQSCLVIGPMGPQFMPDLKWLASEVVKPILEALEPNAFEVSTPSFPKIGNVMYQVIQACDRAPLVVANLTGNNPNVLYEMAVLDAMGRACVPVKIGDDVAVEQDKVPFDRAAYRAFAIPRETTAAIAALTDPIQDILTRHARGIPCENPLTDYFGVPLSAFSSAFGLARGYFRNLIKPVVAGMVAEGYEPSPGDTRDASALRFECVIPDDFDQATRETVRDLSQKNVIRSEFIKAPGRRVEVYSLVNAPSVRLLDIPTTLGALRETAVARLGRHVTVDMEPDQFRELQADEIAQFRRALRGLISSGPESTPDIRKRVSVVSWNDEESPLAGQ